MKDLPKILIVARGVWDDSKGTSSTLTNLFSGYDPKKLAMIYVESKLPNTASCSTFFQIPEIQMVKTLFCWKTSVGQRVDPLAVSEKDIDAEEIALSFARRHRSKILSWLRELLWLTGRWRSSALKNFIDGFDPDLVWLDGSTNIFLDNLYAYVLKVAQKPGVIYLMDDNYTYKSLTAHRYLYHFFHRRSMRRVVSMCKKVLVISPKMKREFDELFQVDSTIITKGIDYSRLQQLNSTIHHPVRLLYMGQIIYGRDYTLTVLIEELAVYNKEHTKIELSIYTNNAAPKRIKKLAEDYNWLNLCKAVPYREVQEIIRDNDVLLFLESLSPKYSRDARLSFSTKITDYLASGKCIFAIGPEDSAPMEYFKEEDCAIFAHDRDGIMQALTQLCDLQTILEYGRKAFATGKKNHDKQLMTERLHSVLKDI